MTIDTEALRHAWAQLQDVEFPGHPDDASLADWVLDLVELDGHVAGCTVAALQSGRTSSTRLDVEVAEHDARLREMAIPDEDRDLYDQCVRYSTALKNVAHELVR